MKFDRIMSQMMSNKKCGKFHRTSEKSISGSFLDAATTPPASPLAYLQALFFPFLKVSFSKKIYFRSEMR
jgi:hypothetical protein